MEDMIIDGPSSSNETSDRISQLPEHLILRILFFLPAKDVARSSILSKAWLSVWNSLPAFSFSSDALSHKENLLKHDASFDAEADEYMDLIEKSLEKLRYLMVRIKRFQLDVFKSHERHVSRFNQFMELANKNQVEELVLHGLVSDLNQEMPSLPLATFASTNSFVLLDLKACVVTAELLKDGPRFPCLREQFLFQVKLPSMDRNRMLENLLDNCPLLENFSLEFCTVDLVKLGDHPKLKKVKIVGVPVICIQAKAIKKFQCEYSGHKPLELNLVSCENLRVLNLHSRFTAEYIQEMVAKSPLLRALILRPYITPERLKISSPSLRFLYISTGRGVGAKEVEIDAPNLEHYQNFVKTGRTATSPVFINKARLHVSELYKNLKTRNLSSQWFIQLKNCLPSFGYNALRICVLCEMTNKGPVLESLRQSSAAPPVYLEVLSVIAYCRPFDFAAFFDCCFWICRPKTILINSSCETTIDLEDLQLDKLIPWEENPPCCRNSQRKCWQHYLDDVKIGEIVKTMDKNYVKHCHGNGNVLTSSPQPYEVELIALHLKWKISGQRRNHRWESELSSQSLFQEPGFRSILC